LTAAERSAVRQNLAVTVSDTIHLNVKGEEPGKLIVLANTWAEVVSQFVNDLYLPDASEHMFLVDQTEEALKDWQDSQQALIEFENVSLVLILRDRLIAEEAELNRYYATQRELNTVLQDLGVLQERLKDQDPESVAQVRDSTAALILSLRATSHSSASFIAVELDESTEGFLLEPSSSINLQIQTGVDSLKGETVEDLIASLDEIIDSIRSYISDLDDSAAELSDGILELQGKIEEIQTSRSRLELVEDQAETVYSALSLRAQEISLMVESQQPILAIASHAVLPAKVVGPDVIVNTAIAGILGFAIAILWVILVEWWRGADAHKENG
jgi:capsular polysaccharide biosynthesis protein